MNLAPLCYYDSMSPHLHLHQFRDGNCFEFSLLPVKDNVFQYEQACKYAP